MSTPTTGSSTEASPTPPSEDHPEEQTKHGPSGQAALLRQVASSPAVVGLLAVLTALILSSILILAADSEVRYTATYLLNRPGDFLHATASTLSEAYSSLLRGAVFDWRATTGVRMIRPITDTLTNATPLIIAGLGMAVAFRAGLFNIGGQGQMILGAITACYVGIAWNLPPVAHLLVAVVGAGLGGLVWGGIAGVLKARTGANEVIVTIMLNSIAAHLLSQVLSLKAFNGEGETGNRKSLTVADTAQYPWLAGDSFRLHAGFLLALLVAVAVWWLMERSRLGFQLRATGLNADAARTAGMSVPWVTSLVMMISGALCGLAATAPVLGTQKSMDESVVGTIGFDAITVALLGRSRPVGTVLAGLLFGALRAGGTAMQAAPGTHIKIVLVLQSTIVLFIAAPPLIRAIFRLPERREPLGGTDPSPASVPAAAPAAPAAKEA
ncbi:ABC transporter permease [Actinomyces oris K20]|uniref:ABC transporter permease n=1 Tax=Actinomyces oris TaxID=544580 RepID=UPI00020034FB|nr:ABC transporter permease [Actinomyces oris]BDF98517.1 ABC transporter permease [Actinomyces oris K20]